MKKEISLASLLAITATTVPVSLVFELGPDGKTPARACFVRDVKGSKAIVGWGIGTGARELDASRIAVKRVSLDREQPVGLLLDVEEAS